MLECGDLRVASCGLERPAHVVAVVGLFTGGPWRLVAVADLV